MLKRYDTTPEGIDRGNLYNVQLVIGDLVVDLKEWKLVEGGGSHPMSVPD